MMIANPFMYGKIAKDGNFTNREAEQARMSRNIASGLNTILISPRRWGKSSLVRKVSEQMHKNHKNICFCFIDLFSIRSEQEFYEAYAKEILKATSPRWEEWIENGKRYLKQIIPKFSIGIDPMQDFSVSFDWNELKRSTDEILSLPETISKAKKINIVVCIDEFQNLSFFDDPLGFQKKLRANWQHHHHAIYCLYGSKRHMMMDLFENKSMPFYKFGDVIFLEKIDKKYWTFFIVENFKKTGKSISPELADSIALIMENHPYFVQQLAHTVWSLTSHACTRAIFEKSIEELIDHNALFFQREIDTLSNLQLNFLKALCHNVEHFSSSETINHYKLGTSGNVNRIKSALLEKEIVDIFGKKMEFVDPLFKLWVKRNM